MKLIFNLKQYLNFGKLLSYTLAFILSLMCLRIYIIQQAIGAESQDEPQISLEVKNQRLGDVLKKITLDTGFKFKLDDQWSTYPVNASIENMPLNRGLILILQGLNHAIIYESDKSIKIMVYGKVEPRKAVSLPIQPFSSQIQDNQQAPTPSSESSAEVADDLKRADESPEETDSSENTEDKSTEKENTEDKSTENEDSSDSGKEESSEETNTAEGTESDQDSSGQSENTNEQNEQESADEDAPPESPQEQN